MLNLLPSETQVLAAAHAQLAQVCQSCAEPLRTQLQAELAALAATPFSAFATLLPEWLHEILPLDPPRRQLLASAGLAAWWYGRAHDDLLDGAAVPTVLIGAQLALLYSVQSYAAAGALTQTGQMALQQAVLRSAAAYAHELASPAHDLAAIPDDALRRFTWAFGADRAAPFRVGVELYACAAGVDPAAAAVRAASAAIDALVMLRQIGDDLSDWTSDLRQGRLNPVSAQLLLRFRQATSLEHQQGIDVERLVGYQVADEPFWDECHTTYQQIVVQGQNALAAYGATRLAELLQQQAANGDRMFASLAAARSVARTFVDLRKTS